MAEMILVVDDEPEIRALLQEWLEIAGYQVSVAFDGHEGLRLLRERRPDLVISDIWMPRMDGFYFIQVVRRISKARVLLITGVPQEAAVLQEMSVGTGAYLIKPFGMRNFLDRVKALLAGETEFATPADAPEEDRDRDARIALGSDPIDRALGGGIAMPSITLIEGPFRSGKSVLCQQIAYRCAMSSYRVAYYTSDGAADALASRIFSLGLDVSGSVSSGQLRVFPLGLLEVAARDPKEPFGPLLKHMSEQAARGVDVVIVDDMAALLSRADPAESLNFFSECRTLSNRGLTIFMALYPLSLDKDLGPRLPLLFDNHLSLILERDNTAQDLEVTNLLEVKKVDNITLNAKHTFHFRVSPEQGSQTGDCLEVLPLFTVAG